MFRVIIPIAIIIFIIVIVFLLILYNSPIISKQSDSVSDDNDIDEYIEKNGYNKLSCPIKEYIKPLHGNCLSSCDCDEGLKCIIKNNDKVGKCLQNIGKNCSTDQDCIPGAHCDNWVCKKKNKKVTWNN